MKLRKIKLLLLFLVFGLTFQAEAQLKKVATVEGITEYNLENGLKVLLFPDNSSQTITVNITYLVGSRHEGYGEKGMAHLLEHMVFKGTPNHPDIPKELSARGARPNGTTFYDRTNYFETFNATDENLVWALDLEADRMVNSYIAKEDLDSEFSVVRNEFESGENSPFRVLWQSVSNAAYQWHNYGKTTIGNRSDIERVPIENLQAFYKKFYRPDNAVLMITGKFEEARVLELVETKFGVLKSPEMPLRDSYTEEPAQDGERKVSVSRVGDLQIVSALYHTPAGSHEEYAGIALIENILADTPSGRLYKKLVDGKKASSLFTLTPFTKEPGYMYTHIEVPSDKNADEVETIFKATMDNFEPITQEELDRAKANIAKEIDQISRDSNYLGTYMSEFIGAGDWRLAFIFRDRVEGMTVEQVNAIASKYFIPSNRTIGRFIPTKDPISVSIPHTENLQAVVSTYKGKEDKGTGEAFDVSYDNIQNRLDSGVLFDKVEYGFIEKENRGETVILSFNMRNGDVNSLMNQGMVPSLTASLLNKGTTSKSRQEIEDELSQLKSSIRFSARNGNIYVSIESTEENLLGTLNLMSEIIKNPSFDEAELDKIKTQRLASLEENRTQPNFLASNRLGEINNTYPKGHPLASMTIEEQIEAINEVSRTSVQEFYNTYYGLGRTTLIAIGNFDKAAVKSFIEKEFKGFESKVSYAELKNPFKVNKAVNENLLTPDKKNAITLGSLAVNMSEYDDEYAALNVAGEILGGGFLNSRIADRLRQKDGVSYGAGGSLNIDGDKVDKNSSFIVYAIYNPDNLDKVQLGFKEEIARFIKDGITEEELTNAVNGWVQGKNVSRAKDNELSSLVNNNIYYNRDMSFHKALEAKVKALSVSDVNAAITKYMKQFSEWTVVNAGDFEREKE
ncbi:M16 family metallopeptidase [Croceitalea vernalis]|uniref:Pitrilysin family protein n=1 Tax=Croceitalea vernalis TaxID=3075599 RepID=A0ABU3BBZ9_9FLAO|nr:pitrilysin family protein [Croceitalea sp. P007]MDT0620006.1 pitrilysin family protein [Croceitalea sp. P007]